MMIPELIKRSVINIVRLYDKKEIKSILKKSDFSSVNNSSPAKIENVGIFCGNIRAYAGGGTSILRIGTFLTESGINVDYIIYDNVDEEKQHKNALINLKNYKGNFAKYKTVINKKYDCVIATGYSTVFDVIKFNGYKLYFVQDYEPYFCTNYECQLLAKKTYEMGLHIISLGRWNKEKILANASSNSNINIGCIDFPYEKKEYTYIKRNYFEYASKKEIKIAVFIKGMSKRLPLVMTFMLDEVKKKFMQDGINLKLYFYGGYKFINKKLGKNLGMISKKQLMDLYAACDFGMVASMTNISLVPYEMLATGLPVIEFEDGSFSSFFEKESALLVSYSAQNLYDKINSVIRNPKILELHNENALKILNGLSWDNTCKQFLNILNNEIVKER